VPSDHNSKIAALEKKLDSMSRQSIHYAPLAQRIQLMRLAQQRKLWHEKPLGFMVITIGCGLVIAFCVFYFGWTK
jgi:hypothetical protein